MLKKEARIFYKDKRAKLSFNEIEEQSIAIANQLLKLKPDKFWDKNLYYHLFLSIQEQREVNTEHLLNILFAKDKEIIVAKSEFKTREMINYLLTENTRIKKNKYNIPEPLDGIEVPHKKIDVVFIPLLAYDKSGNRVGYGKGFYDRLLAKTDCIKIGLSFFEPLEQIEDTNENDIPLNYCITPKTVHFF
jgi:5-formyltetrahydrofolate cyclo-ligase